MRGGGIGDLSHGPGAFPGLWLGRAGWWNTPLGRPLNLINFINSVKCIVYQVWSVYPVSMQDELKTERITTMMKPSEVKAVDAWRREHENLPSRGEAIRRLIELGLEAAKGQAKADNDR